MALAASPPLSLNLSLSTNHRPHHLPVHSAVTWLPTTKPSKFRLQVSPSNYEDREEIRWLREEQRWLREEQRWLREESRWRSERDSLLHEISDLKLKIQSLERHNSMQGASISDTVANVAAMLQVLKDAERSTMGQIADSGSSASPMVLEAKEIREEEKKEEVVVKEIKVLEREQGKGKKVKRKALRKGSEGEEVRAMQEALQKLGFYSGEEDIEFSSFSSGTEHAVKTWQASLGATEDGIMTAELLERLFVEQVVDCVTVPTKGNGNGAAVASVLEISEIQQTIVKDKGDAEVEVSQHRVYLLGENRWEEPSRLSKNKQAGENKSRDTTAKCQTCRGEGRLLCMECDGTGEPNIEPQFIEWVHEGANCPYCEGQGYTICDVCKGKTTA